MMRAFLAIEFPQVIKGCYGRALCTFEEHLTRTGFRWVRPERLHLTLRFLGECSEERAASLEEPVVGLAREELPFRFSIGRAGAFGPDSAPRTLWFSVKEGSRELRKLQPRLERVVREQGFAPDNKEWMPHITVARRADRKARRVRGSGGGKPIGDLNSWVKAAALSALTGLWFEVSEVTLLSSRLTPSGPIYTPVWRAPLGEPEK